MAGFWAPTSNSNAWAQNPTNLQPWDPGVRQNYQTFPYRHNLHSTSSQQSPNQSEPQLPTAPIVISPFASASINRLPLSEPSQQRSSFPLPQPPSAVSETGLNCEKSQAFSAHSAVGSAQQLPHMEDTTSNDSRPISRPISRLSWSSEEHSSVFFTWPSVQDQQGFIDLTTDSSPPTIPAQNSARPAVQSDPLSLDLAEASNPIKRKRMESPSSSGNKKVAEVDLRDVENDEGLAKLLDHQQMQSIRAQKEQGEKPLNFSNLQCIVCLESMTNITVTHCGKCYGSINVSGFWGGMLTYLLLRSLVLSLLSHGSVDRKRTAKL